MTGLRRVRARLGRVALATACLAAAGWAWAAYGSDDTQRTLAMLMSLCGPGAGP